MFPFNHSSKKILTYSSCGICWNLTGFCAWDWRCDFWGFCRNIARLWKGILGRCHVCRHSGLNLLLTSLHVLHPPKCSLWSGCAEPTQLLESKGRTLNLRKGGLVKRLDFNLVKTLPFCLSGNTHFFVLFSIWMGTWGQATCLLILFLWLCFHSKCNCVTSLP